MKAVSKLVVLLGLSTLASVATKAATSEQTYIDTCRKGPGVPVPIAVVAPSVSAEYTGATVELEFVVDKAGNPSDVSIKSATDKELAASVMDAVKQWKFKPADRNGSPVATKVVLPVKIVDPVLEGSTYAAN